MTRAVRADAARGPVPAYADIGPLRMYYERMGSGRPLLLLHAGFLTIEQSFDKLRPALAERWATIAPEQQAHGRTADIDRPLSYAQMVDDTDALLDHLGVDAADVFGWSDGGIVALGLAIRRPERVRRVAIIGAGYGPDAEPAEFKERMVKLRPDHERFKPMREAYAAVAPRPQDWPVLIEKVKANYAGFAGWPVDALRSLRAPLMVMLGDRDFLRPEHALELYRMVPDGRLAILPGADHAAPVVRADWTLAMLTDFFGEE